jgi:hypothetical protein
MRTVSPPGITRATALFGATIVVLVLAGAVGMRRLPGLAFARQVTPFVRADDASSFLVWYRGGTQLDHTYLWNGIGPSIAHARRADVLFLGNSRTQFALPSHELRAFERRSGVSVFAMGLPFGEAFGVPMGIVERFDLRPRVVVANVDGFFRDFQSSASASVAARGWWGGVATIWEERIAAAAWPIASRLLPSFAVERPAAYLQRSSVDGSWRAFAWEHRHFEVAFARAPEPGPDVLRTARAVRDALARRGATLVLTCVPGVVGVACSPETTRTLAAALGVPAVVPIVDGLRSGDIGHLCPLSGKRFGRALLGELGRLDVVRRLRHGTRPDMAQAP